jgi:uridine kinase
MVRLVCVDGPSGAGKTTLAGRLARAVGGALGAAPLTMFPMREGPLGVQVVQLDAFYEGWGGLPTISERLEEWVLGPLRRGRSGGYRRYDWHREEYAEWHEVAVRPVVILEGVGAGSRQVDGENKLKIWIDAPLEIRYERGITRDGETYRPHWDAWAAAEQVHFAENATRERADLLVDGAPKIDYNPETELVLLPSRPE